MDIPETPGMPDMPEMPDTPGTPTLPGIPGEEVSGATADQLEAYDLLVQMSEQQDDVAAEQVTPEEQALADMGGNPLELIPRAIADRHLLRITYINRFGEIKDYTIEPYEEGGNKSHPAGYLWGWDVMTDGIKSFFLSNIQNVQYLEETFVPRF